MNREQQEMALWREAYRSSHSFELRERARDADAAVAQFRQRYPAEPAAPEAAWYDDPPFAKDGKSYPCWVEDDAVHGDVHWDGSEWWVWIVGSAFRHALAGRRVSPIAKPQHPAQ